MAKRPRSTDIHIAPANRRLRLKKQFTKARLKDKNFSLGVGLKGVLIALFLIGSLVSRSAVAEELPKTAKSKSCKTLLQRLRMPLLVTGVLTFGTFGPGLGYDLYGAVRGQPHIGHGIYLDVQNIENLLSETDRELLKNPQQNASRITFELTTLLWGDYKDTITVFPNARKASSFFCGQSFSRGCCRHKSIILVNLLHHYGIRAQLQIGKLGGGWHMWVYLPDEDLIADPAAGWVTRRESYIGLYFSERTPYNVLGYDMDDWSLTPFERGWFR